ncbi:CLUMA_CG016813, isoform A [Clunio marinus]|uniref:CLUMA_CG016813, isoform A n=1 Tax=Clunio marinus TaxID=568069 RepID=A0A1J1ISH0_9DIPT|nr:CLUMA_CG016813, isoform A [Clunio marinus]
MQNSITEGMRKFKFDSLSLRKYLISPDDKNFAEVGNKNSPRKYFLVLAQNISMRIFYVMESKSRDYDQLLVTPFKCFANISFFSNRSFITQSILLVVD